MSKLLSFFKFGSVLGYYTCWLFGIVMFLALIFVMKNYLREDS